MFDQAKVLRGLIEQRQAAPSSPTPEHAPRARTIACVSGKGGVGKSVISLNLAIALRRLGKSVCLLDACLGLGSIDLLCGLNGYWNLSHVVSGARSLTDVVLSGPEGVQVICGASGLSDLADCPENVQRDLLFQMEELERRHDFLIIDTNTGIHRAVRQFALAADQVLVVTVPETTAIADAYATVKALATLTAPPIDLVINQVESAQQAKAIAARIQQTSKLFLRSGVALLGHISKDAAVVRSVASREPYLISAPNSVASNDTQQLARRLLSTAGSVSSEQSFFDRFWNKQAARQEFASL